MSLNATRAAVEEGIVAGGGTTFIDILPVLDEFKEEGDVQTGINLVKRAVEEPVRQIAHNAGLEGSVIVAKVMDSPDGVGFNALKEEYVDMVKAGIVDPAKVTRTALQNAASNCVSRTYDGKRLFRINPNRQVRLPQCPEVCPAACPV